MNKKEWNDIAEKVWQNKDRMLIYKCWKYKINGKRGNDSMRLNVRENVKNENSMITSVTDWK